MKCSLPTISTGKGYTQKRRHAYKIIPIDENKGKYGELLIDLQKLFSHLKIVAYKNGNKAYEKQADFDTIDRVRIVFAVS